MTHSLRKWLFRFYLLATLLTFLGLLGLSGAEVYVRWSVNQNFSFLPGAGYEALAGLFLGQLLGLAYLLRAEK